MEIDQPQQQQQQRERDLREKQRWYEDTEYWFKNHMSLSDLATEMESLFDFLLSKELGSTRKLKPKRRHFIWKYNLLKVLFIKNF